MKKSLSIFLAFVLMFSAALPVLADNQDRYNEAGNILKDLNLLSGDDDGNLMLDKPLKRQHIVVMISRLYGEEEAASQFTGANKFKDLTVKQKRDIPYIMWAVDKGLIAGNPDGTFGHGNDTTVQEYQKVLLSALGYNIRTEDWSMVPELAERYGIMDELKSNPKSKLSRGEMAVMTLNALYQEKNGKDITLAQALNVEIPEPFKVNSTAKIDNNTLTLEGKFTGADSLFVYLKPISSNIDMGNKLIPIVTEDGSFTHKIENLEVGDYHYRFQSGKKYTSYQAISIDVLPFALKDVSASNLKEIHLSFTQPVDKTITSLPSNYTTTAGTIKDIRFEDNDTKIVITLNGTMTQQTKYKLSASKIRSASGEEEILRDYEFEAFDNQLPEIVSIKQLGNKGLRIYFSEPIKSAQSTNFKLNGKRFSSNITLENNMVTLLYQSSYYAPSEGTHSLLISGIEDYAGYKAVDLNHEINIVKDNNTPKIINASATLDRVIVEFDKDIDPVSAKAKNFYWKTGNYKVYANKVTIRGNTAIADFTTNTLSTNENTIYMENIVDYFGNKINDNINVVPTIDTTRPEILSYSVSKDGRTVNVYYSKNVIGTNRKNYTILDEKNKTINIRDIQGSGSEYKINLYSPLPAGYNTLTIEGVQDTTPFKNSVVPFNTSIEMKDIERPRILNSTGYGNNILIHFSKEMDISSITDPSNYIMIFKGKENYLPEETSFTPSNDGKSVAIVLPENYDGDKVSIGLSNNLSKLKITRLKDTVGNDTDPLIINIEFDGTSSGNAKAVDYYNSKPGKEGILAESDLIIVRFSIPIVQADKDDFELKGRKISSVVPDGTDEVKIYLEDSDSTSLPSGSLKILSKNNMKTTINTGVNASTITILDEIPPRVKYDIRELTVYGNQIELPFTEELEDEAQLLYRRDLQIVRLADNTLLADDEYTTRLKQSDKSILVITINNRDIKSGYSIRLAGEYNDDKPSYIRDKDGNLALPSDVYITDRDI